MSLSLDAKLEHVCVVLKKEPAVRDRHELANLQSFFSNSAFIAK